MYATMNCQGRRLSSPWNCSLRIWGFSLLVGLTCSPSVFGQGNSGGDLVLIEQNNGAYEYSLYATATTGWSFGGNGATAIVISGLSGVTRATVSGTLASSGTSWTGTFTKQPDTCGLQASFTSTSVTLTVTGPSTSIACALFGQGGADSLGNLEIIRM